VPLCDDILSNLYGFSMGQRLERATAKDIEELRALATDFQRAFAAGDNETARAANYRFHHRMFEIAAMPKTLHFVQILWARYPFDLINQLKGRGVRAAEEHEDLLRAFLAGDVAAVMLATRQHIEAGWTELRDFVNAGQLAGLPLVHQGFVPG
jgi:DNA-binding GntR family transcriptional regulator